MDESVIRQVTQAVLKDLEKTGKTVSEQELTALIAKILIENPPRQAQKNLWKTSARATIPHIRQPKKERIQRKS